MDVRDFDCVAIATCDSYNSHIPVHLEVQLLALNYIGYSGVMSIFAIENVFDQSCDSLSTPKRFKCAAALPLNQATHFGAGACDIISIAHRQAVVIQHPQ